jgi:hypothetical protein
VQYILSEEAATIHILQYASEAWAIQVAPEPIARIGKGLFSGAYCSTVALDPRFSGYIRFAVR